MTISVSPITNSHIDFKAKKTKKADKISDTNTKNPISRKGEAVNLAKTTFIGGLALGGRLLWELIIEGEFELEHIGKAARKLVEKNKKNAPAGKKELLWLATFCALLVAFVSAVAVIKTLYETPRIMYESKVNSFKKSQEMDVYTKANEAEKSLYEELDNKAKESTPEEKEALKEQYLKLKNAKNQVPDFVNLK